MVLANTNSSPDGTTPVALFTLSDLSAPRLGAARLGTVDEPHAHSARLWLCDLLIGKTVKFETVRSTQDRYYGALYAQPRAPQEKPINVGKELVSLGHAVVKAFKGNQGGASNAGQPDEVRA